jgi:glycosyltransferase involved in cell wall biosynthesis
MRIGIEGQRLFRKKKHGMDMVALELINNLQKIDHDNEYYIYVARDEDKDCLQETDNFKIRVLEGGFYPYWEQVILPKAAKTDGCQLLHCTSNTAPLNASIPLVVTVHDIIYMEKSIPQILTGSGTPYQKFGNVYRRFIVPRIIKKSEVVITVSYFERKRMAEFFGMGDEKLRAVYNGVSPHFKPVKDEQALKDAKGKYNLPEKFFFHLGNTDPKKNTLGVIKAFAQFRRKTGLDIPLVMLDFDRAELLSMAKESGDRSIIEHIHLTGYVPNKELPAIYSQCEIFLYPSLRESFGIPILEAMACGVPVITSNTSSMPEVSGGAALLVDPYKPESISDAMIRLLNDADLRQDLIQKGFEQSAKFTWEAMARQVLDIYSEILSGI